MKFDESAPPAPFPSVCQGTGCDFDPVSKEFNVPIVLRDDLLRAGGNYIEEYVPPKIQMNDKRVFVLTSSAGVDLYHTEKRGMATFEGNQHGMVVLPAHGDSESKPQYLKFYIVPDGAMAMKGLMRESRKLPRMTLRTQLNKPAVQYFVVSHQMVKDYHLTTDGVFIIPRPSADGPYPLKVAHQQEKEKFAIPPKVNSSLEEAMSEHAGGETQDIPHHFIVPVVALLVLCFYIYATKQHH